MNALANNTFTTTLKKLGQELPKPRVILMVSAHWMTKGTWVTGMKTPKTIHDFHGFPQELFDIQYSAPGSPEMAKLIRDTILDPPIQVDFENWGLDHGVWSILRHLYPQANIPVIQLSLDVHQPPEYHLKIGREISKFREQGVLIIGSGNLVHNLRQISWDPNARPHDWALEFDDWIKAKLEGGDFKAIVNDFHSTKAGQLSVPTMEHYLPVHYILGGADPRDRLRFEYEEIQNGSISMRSFSLGRE